MSEVFCLNPKKMAEVPERCSKAFEAVLTKLIEANWRASSEADYPQCRSFLQCVKKDCDSDFRNSREGVDSFLYGYISDKKEFQPLWKVFKLLLTLSHSQASVERGFNVNSEAAIPNLKKETLVSLRTVYDAVKSLDGDLSSYTITKELLASCK